MSSLYKETTFTQRTLTGFVLKYVVNSDRKNIKLVLEVLHNTIGEIRILIQNARIYKYYADSNNDIKDDAFNGTFVFKRINSNILECDLGNYTNGLIEGENVVLNNGTAINAVIDNLDCLVQNGNSRYMILFDRSTPVLTGLDGSVFGFQTIADSGFNTPVLYNEAGSYNSKDINKAINLEGQTFSVVGNQGMFFIENYAGKNVNLKTRIYER